MSQRQQLERMMEIDRQIRAERYPNAGRLAEVLEVSRRVIYSDREFMVNRLGAPIEYDRERGGWHYTDPTFALPTVMVTEGELLAFFLSVEVARKYLGTALEEPLRSAVEKLSQSIRGPIAVDLETLRAHYTFAAPAMATANEETLLGLHRAIQQRRQVWMRYYTASRNEWNERTVNPHHLYNIRGDWYLIAYDHLREQIRNFHIGRIESWQMLDERFEREAGFSADAWMGQAFQTERSDEPEDVAIRFDAFQARYIRERTWHETQTIEDLSDGGLILRMHTGGLGEVRRWVMQYGSHAEVLAPEKLRTEVAEEAVRMARLYDQGT